MANKQKLCPDSLACPLCLEAFKSPTLLPCGHTFCKDCLETYDEKHTFWDYMDCPLCRNRTKLGPNRIAGLPPNFSLRGLQDDLHDECLLPNSCVLHKTECKNIFCEVCEIFICITCFIESHQSHRIIKKEDLEKGLRKKKFTLSQESKIRKTQAEQSVENAEQQKRIINCHLGELECSIRDVFAKKITVLQENEKKLLKEVNDIREDASKHLDKDIAHQKQTIKKIERSIANLTHSMTKDVNDDILIELHLYSNDLEKSLKKTNVEGSMPKLQAVKSAHFVAGAKELLDLGHIEMEGKKTKNHVYGSHYVYPPLEKTIYGKNGSLFTSN
ncbi:tripartite motif-containing protein 59-like [Strongylocentrotus purpuratus]|uniref:Uncharacterized protein n=1 Tax=Strongylocentrotus purpuratus TaxID=7668 RepID=A0A7M7PFK5_STRPU|nr:tripartite motif-containing protein 59-like [Strongylocentrotus purpuratus]